MTFTLFYPIISVLLVSLISFIGVFTLSINIKKLNKILLYLVSFSAGALLGDVFIHLLPEITEKTSLSLNTSIYILLGIIIFFILEKFINWQHCHAPPNQKNHIHPFAYLNLLGDAIHNFIDGLIITASYLISLPAGIATTLAVILHEIPQEIGDFAILIHGGFTKSKALLLNFLTALTALVGALIAIYINSITQNIELFLVPLAIGGFIYIAGSDLIPELHKHSDKLSKSLLQLISFIIGIVIMVLLLIIE